MRFALVLLATVLGQFTVTRGFVVTRAEPVAPQADVVPAKDETPPDDNAPVKQPDRIIFFTTTGCPPCEQCKRDTLPALQRQGLTIGHEITNNVQVIHAATNPEWIKAFKIEGYPTWVRIQNNLITGRQSGYMTADQIQAWRRK